jgi:predicted metal-dependent hydrolase
MFHVKQKENILEFQFTLKRSRRKTVALEIAPDGSLIVKAPLTYTQTRAREFVNSHTDWIEKHLPAIKQKHQAVTALEELPASALKALTYGITTHFISKYSSIIGVKPETVKITSAKKRFGSCSGKNGICFSYYLVLFPVEAIEYVVVHELCHILHRDHSKRFHSAVRTYLKNADKYEEMLHPRYASYNNVKSNLEFFESLKK